MPSRQATLIAPVLAVITTADPLVSMVTGVALLHEKIAAAPSGLAAEGLSLAVTIGGIIALAQRAPQVARILDSPGTTQPGWAAGTASAGPGVARDHITDVRLPVLAGTPACSGVSSAAGMLAGAQS